MRIGVCDDQKEIRELIADKVKLSYPAADVVLYRAGREVLDAGESPDILFLDVQMPDMDGMETAREIRRHNRRMIIIFVTVLEEYVFQSFDVAAFHYLVKPFKDEKFFQVLQRAVKQAEDTKEPGGAGKREVPRLMITAGGKHNIVNIKDIVYAEVFNRKVIVHTMDSEIEYYGQMKELEKKLGNEFFRTHRSCLINFRFVKKYDASAVWLEKGRVLMAKQNYQEFVKSYLKYVRREERDRGRFNMDSARKED